MEAIQQPLLPDEDEIDFFNNVQNLDDREMFFPLNRFDVQLGDFSSAIRNLKLLFGFWMLWLSFIIFNLCSTRIYTKGETYDLYITFEWWFEICTAVWLPIAGHSSYAHG